MRTVPGAAAIVVALLCSLPALADPNEPTVFYADESGTLVAGTRGVGLDHLDVDRFTIVVNASHPDLRMNLDFAPGDATVEAGNNEVTVFYEMRVDVTSLETGLTEASFVFHAPGSRSHVAPLAVNESASYRIDVFLMLGATVDWDLGIVGWRLPQPL